MSSGGLGWTDTGNTSTIGGISKEFYVRVGAKYGITGPDYVFEPHVAEEVFDEMVAGAGVELHHCQRIASVTMDGNRIREITMDNGEVHRAAMFIDASYEGDLMPLAGVAHIVGREANSTYGETKNGVILLEGPGKQAIDAYVVPGNPASGLIHTVSGHTPGPDGSGDGLTQAYNYRMCMTQAANRLPIAPPADYDPMQYELLARYFAATAGTTHSLSDFLKLSNIGNGKTDTNTRGPMSTDYVGACWDYPEVDHLARAEIWHRHEDYTRGLFHFLSTDSRVPANIRSAMQTWGLPPDEFTDNGGWPHQIYVREARRMVSDYVVTELDALGTRVPSDPVAQGSYAIDSHIVSRVVVDGLVRVEGTMFTSLANPYPISYRSIIPKVGECANLFVTFALSGSHASFSSMRMEPVFMMLSQSAATAACMAIDDGVDVQAVAYPKLAAQLLADGQVIPVPAGGTAVVENSDAARVVVTGNWLVGASPGFSGTDYQHDGNLDKGLKSFRFTPDLPDSGSYAVSMWWVQHANRATNVPVDITHANGTTTVTVNQTTNGSQWVPLGTYDFTSGTGGSVLIRTTGTNGYVIADAVRFVPSGPTVQLWTHDGSASEPQTTGGSSDNGAFIVTRSGGNMASPLTVQVSYSGTATHGADFAALSQTVTLPANQSSVVVPVEPLADSEAEGTETLAVDLLDGGGAYLRGSQRTASIALADAPYQDWLKRNFTPAELADPTISGGDKDPDGDGASNHEEALSGTDPWQSDIPSPGREAGFVSRNGQDHLAIEFWRSKSPGMPFQGEVSGNLSSPWQSGPGAVEQSLLSDDAVWQRFRITDRTPVGEAPRRFLRLRITEP